MNRKQKIIVSITGIILVSLILIGLTYAYFLTKITGNTNSKSISVTTANLELVYGDGNGILAPTDKLMPGDTVGTKEFTVTNNGNNKVEGYLVIFRDVTNTLLRPEDLVYKVECKQYLNDVETGTCDGVEYETQLPTGTGSGSGVIVSNDIEAGYVQKYKLTLDYLNPDVDQSDDMNKTIEAKIDIMDVKLLNSEKGITNYASDTLAGTIINNSIANKNGTELVGKTLTKPGAEYSKIKYDKADESLITERTTTVTDAILNTTYYYSDDYVINSENKLELVNAKSGLYKDIYTNLNGKYINKTNTAGGLLHISSASETSYTFKIINSSTLKVQSDESELSVTTDNYGVSYYYRGGVEDNYINFNDMCWKIMRIEGDGSIKLILVDKANTCENTNSEKSKFGQFIGKGVIVGSTLLSDNPYEFPTYLSGMQNNNVNSMANALNNFINGGTYAFEGYYDLEEDEINYWNENSTYDSENVQYKITFDGFSTEVVNNLRNDNYCYDKDYLNYINVLSSENPFTLESGLAWTKLSLSYGNEGIYIPKNIYNLYTKNYVNLNNNEIGCENKIKFSTITTEEIILAGYDNKAQGGSITNYLNDNFSYPWMINGVVTVINGGEKTGSLVYKNKIYDGQSTIGNYPQYIRPSINLKSGTKYITGEGTKNNPYEIN